MRFLMILNFVSDRGDWPAFCKKLKDAGFDGIRGGIDTLLGDGQQFNTMTPFKVVGEWDLGKVVAGWPTLPICTLAEWNEEFWQILEQRLRVMKQYDLVPWFFLEDRCSERDEDWHKYLNARLGCVEQFPDWRTPEVYNPDTGSGLHPRYAGGVCAEELLGYSERVDKRLADLCRTIGFPVFWADPKNENGYTAGSAYPVSRMVEWARVRFDSLKRAGFITVISTRHDLDDEANGLADLADRHGILRPEDFYLADGLVPARTIINTDGNTHGEGDIVSCVWPGYRGPSVDQARTLGEECVSRGFNHVCIIEQGVIDRMTDDAGKEVGWNIDLVPEEVLESASRAQGWTPDPPPPPVEYVTVNLCQLTKKVINTYCPDIVTEKFVKGTEPTAQCVVHKAPDPPPQTCFERYIADRPIRKWQVGKYILCKLGL